MKLDMKNFKWIRKPEKFTIDDDRVEIVTQPGTDLWQRTYYHFRNDNAPVLQMETDEKCKLQHFFALNSEIQMHVFSEIYLSFSSISYTSFVRYDGPTIFIMRE